MDVETLYSPYFVMDPNWFVEESHNTEWSREDNKKFESALAIYDKDTPDRWLKIAEMIPGKTVFDVIKQYRELEEDVSEIEAGNVPIPGYLASSFTFEVVENQNYDGNRRRHGTVRGSDHERKKGVPWTEEEHRRFLMGLLKYGKGDWRNISRNFVVTKTPTQVASHAQKYYIRQKVSSGGKDKRRPSIHDITTLSLTESSASDKNKQKMGWSSNSHYNDGSLQGQDLYDCSFHESYAKMKIPADGQLTKARVEQLGKMQKEIGLSQEYAQKIIKNITTTKMAAAIETAVTQGKLNMKQIRELKESNVDLDSMVSVSLRETIFKKTVGDIFSSGTGEFDEEEVYEKIPLDLNINKEKARGVVCELAQNRLSNSLIQAVALLRQRNHKGVVSSLNNLLACDKAVPSQTLSWEVSEELSDLYTIYLKSDPSPEKLSRLQYLLGINDSTAAALRDSEDSLLETAEEEKFVF